MSLVQEMTYCTDLDKLCYCVLEANAALYSKIQRFTSHLWKSNYLKGRYFYRPPKVAKDDKYGEKVYLFIERGTVVSIQVNIGIGKAATVEVFQYRVLDMYNSFYNMWFITRGKQKLAC